MSNMKYLRSMLIQEMAFQLEYTTDYYVKEICHTDYHVSYALIHPKHNILEYVLVLVYDHADDKMHIAKLERIFGSPASEHKMNNKIDIVMKTINERVHI